MVCRVADMHDKEVINVANGAKLGCVCDVEIDTCTARLLAIIIYGRAKCFGLLGREDDLIITWNDIDVIGEDIILVRCGDYTPHPRKVGFVDSILHPGKS